MAASIQNWREKLTEAKDKLAEVDKSLTELKAAIRLNRIHFSMRTITEETQASLTSEFLQLNDVSSIAADFRFQSILKQQQY
jgi:DNA repair exonuclease SbcCD ATPase subunit